MPENLEPTPKFIQKADNTVKHIKDSTWISRTKYCYSICGCGHEIRCLELSGAEAKKAPFDLSPDKIRLQFAVVINALLPDREDSAEAENEFLVHINVKKYSNGIVSIDIEKNLLEEARRATGGMQLVDNSYASVSPTRP